jgi:nitrogen regulatory protein PII
MRRKRSDKSSKVVPVVMISLCTLIIIYLGMTMFFKNHFYFGSVISGINVAGKTVGEVEKELSSEMETYTLELEERGDVTEQIKAVDIGLKYDGNKIKELKDSQNASSWVAALFKKNDSEISQIVTYDEELLNKSFNKLSCLNSSNIIKPENASFKYTDDGYVIEDEVNGTKINKDTLYDSVVNAILKVEPKINLESSNCYENPQYTSKSQEVADAKNMLDKYANLTITYTSGDKTEVLDGSTIHNWLGVNEKMEVTIDDEKVKKYVDKIASIYNTFGNTRNFVTTSKATIKVSGGNYGWIVDKSKEVQDLIKCIKNGQSTTKEPMYAQTAVAEGTNDIGDTYVEIDMTKQHLWFYKKGSLVTEGDVVTGNITNNTSTPIGTYRLNYKEKNATLKGEDYSSAVTFWMPFNGNVGMHDASWRTEFGKNIYMTSGSHGCVNEPYELANKIYDNIDANTPIVCYYE